MRRTIPVGVLLLFMFGGVGAPADRPGPQPTQERQRPNVLIVVSDDERIESNAATPKLYDWFKDGTIFSRAYATTPHCCPSRASILTGQYLHNHKVAHPSDIRDLDNSATLQRHLSQAGYITGFVGKYVNGWPTTAHPPGFDNWSLGVGYSDAHFVTDGDEHFVDYGPSYVFDQGGTYVETWEGDDEKPWFLMLAPSAPHDPYEARKKYADESFQWDPPPSVAEADRSDKPEWVRKYNRSRSEGIEVRAKQLRTLRTVDEKFMETIELLEEYDELENTLVIYVSDNGFMWSEHGLSGKGVPYSGSIRVPLYVRGPGVPKRTNSNLVGNIDIAPTVYEAADLEPTHKMDGLPLFSAKRENILLEFSGSRAIPKWESLVGRDYQYIEYEGGGREFYDLEADPFQLENRPGRAGPDLAEALQAARVCAGGPCP